jgi:RNA polymerase sigma-70 factor, ECF subfamily
MQSEGETGSGRKTCTPFGPALGRSQPARVTTLGEDIAAARLFERYGDRIYRFCLVRLRSREEAEDAVQNTFLRVYQALRKGQTPRWEEAWLFKIAYNVCLSRVETTRRRAAMEVARDPDDLECEAHGAPAETLMGLPDALAGMPANLRTAFLLREWKGLSYAEIAETMGTTVSAVETLIVRARRRLAAELERAARAVGGFALPFAGRLRAALVASAPAKVAASTALLAVGAAGFGAAVVGTSAPPRPARAPASTSARLVPATARPVHALTAAPAPSVAAAPRRAAVIGNTTIPGGGGAASAPSEAAKTAVSASAPGTVTTLATSTTADLAAVLPADTVGAVSVPSLPPPPALPVSTDAAVPSSAPVSTDVQLPPLPPLP